MAELINLGKSIKCFFAVRKEINTITSDLLYMIRLQLQDDFKNCGKFNDEPIPVTSAACLEIGASGLVMVGAGRYCRGVELLRNCNVRYNLTMKLGIATTTLNTYGCVVGEKPFDHVTREVIGDKVKKYCGWFVQKTPPRVKKRSGELPNTFFERNFIKDFSVSEADLINSYVYKRAFCQSIDVTGFNPPYVQLDVLCKQKLHLRQLVADLAADMNTYAYMTKVERIQHGPFTLEDVLPSHQWDLSSIQNATERSFHKLNQFMQVQQLKMKNTDSTSEEFVIMEEDTIM